MSHCKWTEDVEGNWWTDCGDGYIVSDGTPADNHMMFCCFCGKPLKEVFYTSEEVAE